MFCIFDRCYLPANQLWEIDLVPNASADVRLSLIMSVYGEGSYSSITISVEEWDDVAKYAGLIIPYLCLTGADSRY